MSHANSLTAHPIRFLLNAREVSVQNQPITTSVLAYLRSCAGLMGTKEGCAEGDCGACTVVIGELDGNDVKMKSANACIQFLPTLDGKAVFTVEALRGQDGELHPVQQAMVETHASQCGFCTPGFVMSLWALYLENKDTAATEGAVRQAITGNLCRCTGYRPIVDAGMRMQELPKREFNFAALQTALKSIERKEMFEYQFEGFSFMAPKSMDELMKARALHPDAIILAGGTDIGLWVSKQLRGLPSIIYVGEVAELRNIAESEKSIVVGAAVSLQDAYKALKDQFPEMSELWERFASVPIRNVGTLGGNIANGSPIGDSMPALIALGSNVVIAGSNGQRQVPLESLYVGYQQKYMAPTEIVVAIEIPKRRVSQLFRVYKVAKRYDSDISAICGAFVIELDGNLVGTCRIAFGGMAGTPKRAEFVELAIIGKPWSETTVNLAIATLPEDFQPLTDMRASADYRVKVAGNLIRRFFLETRINAPMASVATDVFAHG